ncbi:MAG TPA: UvrD-helicase domain-containing protein, partial [Acidimicrobiales bacterium]|nr:UvrD-helicase domain-containing protein [Acidimicrobiales bacterium]
MSPPDQAARDRIATDLETTLFVEAGAGSGKTTALVGRVVALVTSGAVELRHIAAITFTEKAGAELRDRVRRELEARAVDQTTDPSEAERCRVALGQLDGAAIGTLHAFAQRLLSEHPVEAALPPRVEVLDEVSSAVEFDRRWARVLDDLLADPGLERTILLLSCAGVDPTKLRSLALAFEGSWDLVEELVPDTAPEPRAVADLVPRIHEALRPLRDLARHCMDPTDPLLECLHRFVAYGGELDGCLDDDLDLLDCLLAGVDGYRRNAGRAGSWDGRKDEVHARIADVLEAMTSVRRAVLDGCAHHLGAALRRHTLGAAEGRRDAGTLEFHDLLVLARRVLRDPVQGPVVRASLHQRYQRLLLDEFQDTDPIQIELAVRIAAADPARADEARWRDVAVAPGRLFVVGDPKQSIYRFRRADVGTFLTARDHFAPAAGGAVELTANFRTVAPIIDWVNHTFATLLHEPPDTDLAQPSQPAYVDLQAQRAAAAVGPPVAVVGTDPHPPRTPADVIRSAESRDV